MASGPNSERPTGHVIADKYRLIEKLGQGGMGTVWLAQHLVLGSHVAIKLIDNDEADRQELVSRFLREAKAAAALQSAHVVRIHDYGVESETPYMVMEYLHGESLAARLKRESRLTPALVARILTHVGRAMSKAHAEGIVHRDLKPENIFLIEEDDGPLAKVLDFGIAKDTRRAFTEELAPTTGTGAVLGTPFYMSPEQARARADIDHRSDLWALGVIAYECITGFRPFDSDNLSDLLFKICVEPLPVPSNAATVPAGFDDWFARATAREAGARYGSAREMIADLRKVLTPADRSWLGGELNEGRPAEVPAGAESVAAVQATGAEPVKSAVPPRPLTSTTMPTSRSGGLAHTPQHAGPSRGVPRVAAVGAIGIAGVVIWGAMRSGESRGPVDTAVGSQSSEQAPAPPPKGQAGSAGTAPPAGKPEDAGAAKKTPPRVAPAASATAEHEEAPPARPESPPPKGEKIPAPRPARTAPPPKTPRQAPAKKSEPSKAAEEFNPLKRRF